MHILTNHLPETMRLHGNIVDFCQQGLEKLNYMITKWYFRSTNFDQTALTQSIRKHFRISQLEKKSQRPLKFQVSFSRCDKSGHSNKRICTDSENA